MMHGNSSRILIMDDHDENADAISELLQTLGYRVERCVDALAGVEYLARTEAPDLILLDLNMPRMNGWEFRVMQRRNPAWASIPVVALSGDTSAKARSIDVDAYLTKPVDSAELIETLDRVL